MNKAVEIIEAEIEKIQADTRRINLRTSYLVRCSEAKARRLIGEFDKDESAGILNAVFKENALRVLDDIQSEIKDLDATVYTPEQLANFDY